MALSFYRTVEPELIDVWQLGLAEHAAWCARMEEEEQLLGRAIFCRFPERSLQAQVVGIGACDPVPPGWVRVPGQQYLAPAPGLAGQSGRDWLAGLAPPLSAEEHLVPFGLWTVYETEEEIFWPGVELLDDGLYVTWEDNVWPASPFFQQVPAQDYYAALSRTTRSDVTGCRTTPGPKGTGTWMEGEDHG